jgi:hypothetical protein
MGEAELKAEIEHVGDCLECLSMDVVAELETLLAGKTACDALRHAQAAEIYRNMGRTCS